MSEKTPKAVPADAGATVDLYEIQRTIHPRAVHGWFASWRIALVLLTQLVFYGTLWLNWNGRQAVLFDLASRKFYIFGLVFWPQDFIFLTTLLVISAVTLFLFTAIAGRLWCGYACPQTVYTEIFMWIERKIEGDRNARIALDKSPWNVRKFRLKAVEGHLHFSQNRGALLLHRGHVADPGLDRDAPPEDRDADRPSQRQQHLGLIDSHPQLTDRRVEVGRVDLVLAEHVDVLLRVVEANILS